MCAIPVSSSTNRPEHLMIEQSWCLQKFAEAYPKTLFLKFYGNSNANTKHLIEQRLTVGRTPTFTLFSQGRLFLHLGFRVYFGV